MRGNCGERERRNGKICAWGGFPGDVRGMAFPNFLSMPVGLELQLQAPAESQHVSNISCLTVAIPHVTEELLHKRPASEEQRVTNNLAG